MTVIKMNFKTPMAAHCNISSEMLYPFMKELVNQFHQSGRERTAETYSATLNSFARYRKREDIPICDIDEELIMGYETYLRECGLSPNSSSFYMRVLRATYNRAVERGYTLQRYPFKRVYTGIEKTAKRAISLKQIRKIKTLDLSATPTLEFARDVFLFSFYTRGMSLIDIMFLTPGNIANGRLVYTRHKTGQQLSVRWEKCMQEIVKKHSQGAGHYLLPLIAEPGVDERAQYKKRSSWIGSRLRAIGLMIGLDAPLTMYVARHSWASIARSSNIPLSIISEGMGHDSELTTRIYLSALDYRAVDEANRRILQML